MHTKSRLPPFLIYVMVLPTMLWGTHIDFTEHIISTSADGAVSVYATDLDGDGDIDVLSASENDNKIAWYENDGENFTEHLISTSTSWASCVYSVDVDGDGDMDVLFTSATDNKIGWYENDDSQNFTEHVISTSAYWAISVHAVDLDGDGDMDVLAASQEDDKIAWHENDGSGNFTEHVISTSADFVWAVYAADMDSDGDMDVLSASEEDDKIAWYENDGSGNFTEHAISTSAYNAHDVHAADVDGDGDMDVLAAYGDYDYSTNRTVWYENDGSQNFTEHGISINDSGNYMFAWTVHAADVDGDGDMDVLSDLEHQGGGEPYNNPLFWYENDGSQNFTQHTISETAATPRSVYPADVDSDGDLDVLLATSEGDKIAWWENNGSHASPNTIFVSHEISTSADGAVFVHAADVDSDGDMDVLSASQYDNKIAWYENDGENFTEHVISTSADFASYVYSADVDGDGDMDVLSASQNDGKIAWYENDGNQNFTEHAISIQGHGAMVVSAADVDGDGDMDLLSAANNEIGIAWYENDGSQNFTEYAISTEPGVDRVYATDFDGDGDMDVVSSSYNDKVAWYENDGSEGFTEHVISTSADNPSAVQAVDVDGDGDMDVLAASQEDDKIAWHENDGNQNFTEHAISTSAGFVWHVYAVDVDGDGDMDILSTHDGGVVWYENNGQESFTEYIISTDASSPRSVFAADIDGDGDMDVLSASANDDKIAWYEHIPEIIYTYVPDDYFEQYLIDLGYDDTLDDYVPTHNISGVTNLNITGSEISDLTGIKDFTALTILDCESNQLTSLDMSNNTALTTLNCQHNQLTTLDMSNNTALTELRCGVNQLTSLDVSNNTALLQLHCWGNQLTSLDVSSNTVLEGLNCQENQLTSLDLSNNTALTVLYISNNVLIHLNMKNGVTDQLAEFEATDNSLTCIETLDSTWAIENWTYENGNIDQGVVFELYCGPDPRPKAFFFNSGMYLVSAPGDNTQFSVVLSNNGEFTLDYTVTVNATFTAYTWLSTVESGQVLGDSTVNIPVSLNQTENMSPGTYIGYLYFSTNTGIYPEVIVANTDTVTVELNLLADDTQLADTTVIIPAGNIDPINFVDGTGQPMGITVDFEYSDGGSVMVQSISTQPPIDETLSWEDPDGQITAPAFPNKYFEISTDIAGDYWVNIGLDYTIFLGIDNPQALRLAMRSGYAGTDEPWTIIAVANTEINTIDGLVVAKNQTSFSQWAMISNSTDNSFIDTEGPVISNITLAPTQPSILEDVTITADLEDGSGIDAATLYYMQGGGSVYTSVTMAGSAGSYTGTIPGSAVTINGLFYYVVGQDPLGQSTASDTLETAVQFITGSLTTGSATGSAYPNGLPKDAWRLISIPALLDETDVGLVIGDELGSQDDNTWRIFEYDQTTASYKENPVDFSLGESYWLYQKVEDNLALSATAGETGNLSGTELTINSGWNFIGSPYPFPIPLVMDQVQFYGPITYGLSGDSWSSVVTELDPWNGYVVYNRTASDKTITMYPSALGATVARKVDEVGWLMGIQVSAGEYEDNYNTFGAIDGADNQRDWRDNPEITAPGSSVSLAFIIPEEDNQYQVTSDIRSLDQTLKVWNGRIKNNTSGSVSLSWSVVQNLPPNYAVELIDLNTRITVDMLSTSQLSLGPVDSRYDRRLNAVAGGPEEVSRKVTEILSTIPEELSLNGNYPNPFNPVTSIRFGLPEPRKINLSIINILGQEVAVLVNGWQDIGHHEVRWEGMDSQGIPVASGVYFAVLRDSRQVRINKMMLIK